jgi:hypothetical protein
MRCTPESTSKEPRWTTAGRRWMVKPLNPTKSLDKPGSAGRGTLSFEKGSAATQPPRWTTVQSICEWGQASQITPSPETLCRHMWHNKQQNCARGRETGAAGSLGPQTLKKTQTGAITAILSQHCSSWQHEGQAHCTNKHLAYWAAMPQERSQAKLGVRQSVSPFTTHAKDCTRIS